MTTPAPEFKRLLDRLTAPTDEQKRTIESNLRLQIALGMAIAAALQRAQNKWGTKVVVAGPIMLTVITPLSWVIYVRQRRHDKQ